MTEQRDVAEKEITVGYGGNTQTIRVSDILYAESSNHKIILHLHDTRIEHYGKISALEQALSPGFFRIHRGYLINLNRVAHYDRSDVYMDNGDRLIISRYKYREFMEVYLQHTAGNGQKSF